MDSSGNSPSISMKSIANRTVVLFTVLVLSFSVLYRDVFLKLVHDWSVDENYSHGFLVIPIALYLASERRTQFAKAVRQPNAFGLLIVVGGLAMLTAGVLGAEVFTTEISMLATLTGSLVFLFGWSHLRVMLFPIAFLILMIPLPAIIFNQITFPLQLLASRFGEGTLQMAGIPFLREGNL